MEILELTVISCLHLVRIQKETDAHQALGSGVIVRYKDRFFVCTVAHFTDHAGTSIGIITGRAKDSYTEVYILGDFSYMDRLEFEELPDAEDLELILQNPERSSIRLDIAFREIPQLENIYQPKRVFDLSEGNILTINEGGKSFVIVDAPYEIHTSELGSFCGRIRPNFQNGILEYQEQLYWGLSIVSLSEDYVKMDLGGYYGQSLPLFQRKVYHLQEFVVGELI